MPPKIELQKIRDFGEIISDTLLFARQNFKPLITSFFIFCGFFIAGGAIFSILQQIKTVNAINTGFSGRSNLFGPTNPFSFLGIEYVLSILFFVMGYVAMQVTIYSFICLYKEKGNIPPTPAEVWGYFKYYYVRIFLSGIVIALLLMVASVLCLIPGIYLYPIMALVFPIMIFENTSFGYAFNRSFRLIKENWWLTFGAIVVMIIIVYFVSMIVILPASIFNAVSMFSHFGREGVKMSATAAIITALLGALCQVFYILHSITVSLCYFNLTERVDNTGLIARIGQLGDKHTETDLPGEQY